MKDNNSKEYIKFLESKVKELSNDYSQNELNDILKMLSKINNDLYQHEYFEKDNLLRQNKELVEQINNHIRTLNFCYDYIYYLSNSFWWKISYFFRFISRNIKKIKYSKNKQISFINNEINVKENLDKRILVLISTFNPGEEIIVQLDNLLKQKLLNNLEIIIVDYGSTDKVVEIAKTKKIKVLEVPKEKAEYEMLENSITENYDYVIYLNQNKIIEDDYWIIKAIKPIENKQASSTAIFDRIYKNDIDNIKKETFFYELRSRFCFIGNNYFFYLPLNRNNIQYLNPWIIDKTSAVVKKMNDKK